VISSDEKVNLYFSIGLKELLSKAVEEGQLIKNIIIDKL